MRQCLTTVAAIAAVLVCVSGAQADVFGTGANEFTIDLVSISGDASSANGTNISQWDPSDSWYRTFTDPASDYRMGTFEVTYRQWNSFAEELGVRVTGTPATAYDNDPYLPGAQLPADLVSWYEAAQFVNWLNTSTGHQAAYKFAGTQGQSDYALDIWSAAEADDGTNLFRHKDAFYFLPTEDEWVKAAYWNGTTLQTYATRPGESLHQGDGTTGTGWNYSGPIPKLPESWEVGSGSEELNGTFDMMGNVWEWLESPFHSVDYDTDSVRGVRGGSYINFGTSDLSSSNRYFVVPFVESNYRGFRVASRIPEPATLSLLALGGLAVMRRRR